MIDFWISCPLNQHDYHIQVRVPTQPPPLQGYSALYMLDGDWSMGALQASEPHPEWPIVLIAIGYGTDLAVSRAARAYDYTPYVHSADQPEHDPRMPQWRSGGADTFLAFLEDTLIPRLEPQLKLNPACRTLYGHSYGGLFVLHALYQRTGLFSRYVAASPSLWWRNQHLISMADGLRQAPPSQPTQLLLMVGEGEAWYPLPAGADPSDPHRRNGIPTLPMAQTLNDRLQSIPQLCSSLQTLPGLNHADMLSLSTVKAISFASTDLSTEGTQAR